MSMSVEVAFIVVGTTHAAYYKTLKHALGIDAVGMDVFMDTIYAMYRIVKSVLDDSDSTWLSKQLKKRCIQFGSRGGG